MSIKTQWAEQRVGRYDVIRRLVPPDNSTWSQDALYSIEVRRVPRDASVVRILRVKRAHGFDIACQLFEEMCREAAIMQAMEACGYEVDQ